MKMHCVGRMNFLVVNKPVTAKLGKEKLSLQHLCDGTTQRNCYSFT